MKKLKFQMRPVESSNIAAVGHDANTNTLAVQFQNGGLYHYSDVPAEKYEALRAAKSVGGHFHAHVKGAYPSTKVA